jgi:short-subunit dehydrogenase
VSTLEKKKQVVLITGASIGLGLSFARRLLNENFHLVLTARASSLSRFAQEGIFESDFIWLRPLDVTHATEREALISEIDEKLGGVDVLVNNAGFAFRSVTEHLTERNYTEEFKTNYMAPMELSRLVLPLMRKKKNGKIINISSVGGMMAMPTMGAYSASKWALEGASESLWYEVRPWNIRVTLLQLGFINSESFGRVRMTKMSSSSNEETNDPYHWHYHYMAKFIGRVMRLTPHTPEAVANRLLKIIRKRNPPLRMAGTVDAHAFGVFRRLFPRYFYHLILYYSLPGIRHWGK